MGIVKLRILFWLLGFSLEGSFLSWALSGYQNNQTLEQCKFTRYPSLCVQTLKEMGNPPQDMDILPLLINKTISETKLPTFNFQTLSSQLGTKDARRARSVSDYCKMLMDMSLKRLDQSLLALEDSKRHKHNIQAWLSAVVTFQQTCKDSVEDLPPSMAHISQKMDYLSQLSSNPLSLINRVTSSTSKSPKTSQSNQEPKFPNWVWKKDRKLLQSTTIKANAVVAKDGSGNYKTVSEAIQAASGNRFVIYVKSGIYKEKIRTNKDGITLIGDGKDSSVIVGDDSVAAGSSMPGSATFTVTGDGFLARDIGFANTAGPREKQALALNIASDRSVLFRCSISGYQDTLYALALRQFYRDCDIYGTIDFIFGNAAAVFQNCNLVLRHRGFILANGRTDPGQTTGFIVQKSTITGSSATGDSYLGRPWKRFSRSVVMQSTIGGLISAKGWAEWPGEGGFLKSVYFAEFGNDGPGAVVSQRVRWPGFHVIGPEEATRFTVASFIAGTSWLPSTGVTFVSGLQ